MVFSRLFLLDGTQRHRQLSPRKYSVFQVYQIPVHLILPTFYVSCKANGCLYLVYANFLSWHDLSTSQLLFEDKPWIFRPWIFGLPSSYKAVFVDEPVIFGNPSSYKAVFEDRLWIFSHPSSYRPVFEDRPWIFGHPSSYRPVFEDRLWIFGHPSSYKAVFEDRLQFPDFG